MTLLWVSNPGHIGEKRVLPPLHPCSCLTKLTGTFFQLSTVIGQPRKSPSFDRPELSFMLQDWRLKFGPKNTQMKWPNSC